MGDLSGSGHITIWIPTYANGHNDTNQGHIQKGDRLREASLTNQFAMNSAVHFSPPSPSSKTGDPDIMAYASSPLFGDADGWTIEGNPYRRPVRPQDLWRYDFSAPLSRNEFCSGSALAAQRMLLNIYETDSVFLPDGDFRSVRTDFNQFYSPENRLAGERIRSTLERHVFCFLDKEIDTAGKWSVDAMTAFFDMRLAASAKSESAVKQAVLSAASPEEAAKVFLIQVAPDFLSEATAMARNVLGNYGPVLSELFKVLIDEYGYGVHSTKHSTLYGETMKNRGLSSQIHAYWQFYLTSSLALTNYFHYISKNHELFFRYIGALYYTEASLVYATRHQSKMLRGVWGEDVDTRYFDEHTHIDKHHGRMVIDNIIKPLVEQCGESIIPEIVRGFEEFRLLQDMADEDLIAQIAWADQRDASTAQAQRIVADDDKAAERPWKVFHETEDEISITHVHEKDELFVVDEGELDFVTGYEQSVRLGPGEGIVIPRHRLHGSIVTSQECTYRVSPIEAGEPCSS